MMSLALHVGNWWESCGDELWGMNPRRSNFVVQGEKCDHCGGNQAWMIYQLSRFSFFFFAFHQNYTHYSLKGQSVFFDHTYLLSKREFILLVFFKKKSASQIFVLIALGSQLRIFLSTIDFNGGISKVSSSNFYREYLLYCGFGDDLKSE